LAQVERNTFRLSSTYIADMVSLFYVVVNSFAVRLCVALQTYEETGKSAEELGLQAAQSAMTSLQSAVGMAAGIAHKAYELYFLAVSAFLLASLLLSVLLTVLGGSKYPVPRKGY